MVPKFIFTLLFILPALGSLNIFVKGIKNELIKLKATDQKISAAKVIGFSLLSLIGLYIALFLIWFIWFPSINLSFGVKLVSWLLTAPYLLGVIGIGIGLSKATEIGASPSKMANTVSGGIKES